MKLNFLLAAILLAAILLAATLRLSAATNDLTSRLQQGLFDEEASRDLNAAIADYQALAAQYDQDRQIAATAIYRLGECYRKLGQTNDAVTQYQRLIREFADQKDLVTLSQQNLTGLGVDSQTHFSQRLQAIINRAPSEAKTTEATGQGAGEAQSLAIQLAGLDQLKNDPEKRAYTVLALFPDNDLNNMLVRLPLLKEQEAQARANTNTTFTVTALPFDATAMSEDQFFHQVGKGFTTSREGGPSYAHEQIVQQLAFIGLRVDFIVSLQQARLQALQSGVGMASGNPGNPSAAPATVNSIPDLEGAEILRIQQMIQNSPDLINAPGENGLTPLARAAADGWLKVAAYLLDHGAEVNSGAGSIVSPLCQAARAGNRAMVELLLSRGADVNPQNSQAPAPLNIAVNDGFPAVVEVLLAAKAGVNVADSDGNTPLHGAAANGQNKITQMLLSAGANPNAKSNDGGTPLMAAPKHATPDILRRLLAAGADPNAANNFGRTALSYTAELGTVPELQVLLAAKADPNVGTLDLPIMFAIDKGDLAAAECLLKAGANPNTLGSVDGELRKPVGSGRSFGNFYHVSTPLFFAAVSDQLPLVQLLLKYHADPNDERTDGRSLLFGALDKPDILAALLDAGAKVDARDLTGNSYNINGVSSKPNWTPLIQAFLEKQPTRTIEALLNHGANANLPDNSFGRTPLLWSDGWGADRIPDQTAVELLLAHHADPNLRSFDGRTLLDNLKMAAKNSTPDRQATLSNLCDLLRQHGALDHLPDWNHITASRPDANFARPAFSRDTNNWNQFTLLELIAVECRFLAATPASKGTDYDKAVFFDARYQSLPFPDLSQLRIHRPTADQKTNQEITINLGSGLQSGDCSHDVPLAWGDVVEIPETDHALKEAWPGFTNHELENLRKCLTRHITIIVKGQTNTLTLAPKIELAGTSARMPDGALVTPGSTTITSATPFWLGPVLLQSQLVLTSSDLSGVQVTRRDPATGKTRTCTVDCSGISQNQFSDSDLWLCDGDVIEIPEKP